MRWKNVLSDPTDVLVELFVVGARYRTQGLEYWLQWLRDWAKETDKEGIDTLKGVVRENDEDGDDDPSMGKWVRDNGLFPLD